MMDQLFPGSFPSVSFVLKDDFVGDMPDDSSRMRLVSSEPLFKGSDSPFATIPAGRVIPFLGSCPLLTELRAAKAAARAW